MEDIKQRIVSAIKGKRNVEKNILRLVLADVEKICSTSNCGVTDEQVESIVRKMIQRNNETACFIDDKGSESLQTLLAENAVLETLLPTTLTQDEIEAWFLNEDNSLFEQIRDSKSDGQATGLAIKALKSAKLAVLGSDVKAVVEKIRNES